MSKNIWKTRINAILIFLSMVVTVNLTVPAIARNSSQQNNQQQGNSNQEILNTRRTRTPVIRQETRKRLQENPPTMCRIQVIRYVLRWKCPKMR
jgi:Flp pilus assembly secretin CpaC